MAIICGHCGSKSSKNYRLDQSLTAANSILTNSQQHTIASALKLVFPTVKLEDYFASDNENKGFCKFCVNILNLLTHFYINFMKSAGPTSPLQNLHRYQCDSSMNDSGFSSFNSKSSGKSGSRKRKREFSLVLVNPISDANSSNNGSLLTNSSLISSDDIDVDNEVELKADEVKRVKRDDETEPKEAVQVGAKDLPGSKMSKQTKVVGKKIISTLTAVADNQLYYEKLHTFACHLCEKSFAVKDYLAKHIRRMHDCKMFKCRVTSDCPEEFRTVKSLETHEGKCLLKQKLCEILKKDKTG